VPDMPSLAVFMLGAILLNLTPGPDMLYVLARSAGQGRRAGVVSALGIGIGTLVHTLAAAVGLSALLLSSALAYDIIKDLGAMYLIYLGIRMIASQGHYALVMPGNGNSTSLANILRQAVITNVLNPKVALFFLAFMPQFVDPTKGAVAWQFALLGLMFDTSGTLVNITVAQLAGYINTWMTQRPGFSRAQRWLTGSVLIALGARLALGTRR